MKPEARELDQLIRDWHLSGANDDAAFQRILVRALRGTPTSLVPYARALHILEKRQHPAAIQGRVDELRGHIDALRTREWQIDDLGDLNNEPQSLFDILGDDVAGLEGFDPERVRQARLPRQETRAGAARGLLEALGWDRLPTEAAGALAVALDDLEEREQYQAWGLFVDRAKGDGLALGVKVALAGSGQENLWSEADREVVEQARTALRLAIGDRGWAAKIEWPASYVGESIGLPLYVAGLVANESLPHDSLIASTGRLDIGGAVTGVTGIKEKIEAARRLGIRRILLARENLDEAKAAAGDGLLLVPVSHVDDVRGALRQSGSSVELGYSGLVRLVRASIKDYGLVLQEESDTQNGRRFVVANTRGKANVWVYSNGRVRPDGPPGPALDAAARLIAERVPPEPEQRATLTFQVPSSSIRDGCRAALHDAGAAIEPPGDHEQWRMRLARGRSRATIVLYKSGKCVLQGTAPAWDAAHDTLDRVTEAVGGLPKPEERPSGPPVNEDSPSESEPHIGTDEAGKGDYFGPLVSAAVYVDSETAAGLRHMGVRDSKTLSDKRVRELAREIRRVAEGNYAVTPINPRKFNELYEQFRREGKNLNSLLAWGHGRSIDNLLSRPNSKRARAKYVIVDQFGDKHYIEERTRRAGIPVLQRHKAEADIAVAAASVLARDGFLQWIERWSERTQISLPKGASSQVIEAAKQFVRRWGARWLGEVAKLNFRTTQQVLTKEDSQGDARPPWSNEAAD